MKTIFRLLIGLGLVVGLASAHAELSPVAFVIGKQQFKPGDSIVIDQVLATSPKIEAGTKLVVRGHYELSSAAKASVGLFVTHRSPAVRTPDAFAPSQVAQLSQASGSFELSCDVTYDGDPHVSFYPDGGGNSFGGVYFSLAPKT
jgi:hypothetical protein